jgi:hypothetical protein
MSWADVKQFLENFRTDQIMQLLQNWNVGDLSTNPWFLGGFVTIILITYFIGWRAIAGFLAGIGGFILVLSLAVGKGTGVEGIAGGGLWILVCGGAVAVFLFIYLLFIKSE